MRSDFISAIYTENEFWLHSFLSYKFVMLFSSFKAKASHNLTNSIHNANAIDKNIVKNVPL